MAKGKQQSSRSTPPEVVSGAVAAAAPKAPKVAAQAMAAAAAIDDDHWYNARVPTYSEAEIGGAAGALDVPKQLAGNFPTALGDINAITPAVNRVIVAVPPVLVVAGLTFTPARTADEVITITITGVAATAEFRIGAQVGRDNVTPSKSQSTLPGATVADEDTPTEAALALRTAWVGQVPGVVVTGATVEIILTVTDPETIPWIELFQDVAAPLPPA